MSAAGSGERACKTSVRLDNKNGLHARPAHMIVQTANGYASALLMSREGEEAVDAKSIMNVMMLAAEAGTVLEIESRGPDCEEQLRAIVALFESRFGED